MSTESTRRHVFISHHHKDDATVDKMTRLLERRDSDTRNSSIRVNKPENQEKIDKGLVAESRIRRLLRMKISWAGTVVVIIGKETHSRPWVDWEIQEAERQGKRIVGVWEEGGKDHVIPANLDAYADAIVGWQADQILGAIDGEIDNWNEPEGNAAPPREVERVKCQ